MFRRLETAGDVVRFEYEGRTVEARPGDTVAAALLAAGETPLRITAVSGSPRAPYCMMGVCFECLMEIDGVGNRQACLTSVAEGMQVRRQRGARGVL
jgi:predicted molibdopterin-dependent oxidoreductase YjgC